MPANNLTLIANSYFGGSCTISFDDSSSHVVSDTRRVKDGYLHTSDDSPAEITTAVRDTLLRYAYISGPDLPGLGDSVQKYFSGLSLADCERIGNNGARGIYAAI